ncbi:MAG: hypothetical protein WD342_16920 [Verrucomicrobiales bacterium]
MIKRAESQLIFFLMKVCPFPVLALALLLPLAAARAELSLAVFEAEATPPLGSPLCNGNVDPAAIIVTPLMARGVVLLGAGDPIVLCALDWVGIGNESHDAFRSALAEAVATSPDRVAVHAVHQHDAPGSDFATERLLAERGLAGRYSNADFDREVIARLAAAAEESLSRAEPVTHFGLGRGKVERVASNRRILGPDGKVVLQRQSSGGRNPAAREAPEGTIDPYVHLVSFWNGETPLAALNYYATHPMSFYGRGLVNWDLVGMAREDRAEALGGVPHLYFTGAGGNIAAGKYNDGSEENRPVLAERLEEGMLLAWDNQKKQPLAAEEVDWRVVPVAMPVRDTLVEEDLLARLDDDTLGDRDRVRAARDLAFLRRTREGHRIPLACLRLGEASVLHFPGELFVEYQLAAQRMRSDAFVALAAYGDYGPGYIGTEISYSQGGYETGSVSRVAPEVEGVLKEALRELLAEE